MATQRAFQGLRDWLSIFVIVALVLPASVTVVPSPAQAADNSPAIQTTAPTPAPTPIWPEVASQPLYQPDFAPANSPETNTVAASVAAASSETVAVDSEANKTGVVTGAASATLSPTGGQVALGALQLSLTSAAGALAQAVNVQAEVLPATQANALSPVGMAFHLKFASAAQVGATASALPAPQHPLSLTLDYSQIPLRYGGGFADRLTLYRVADCQTAEGGALDCATWTALPGQNDRIQQQLTVSLPPLTTAPAYTATTPAASLPQRLYLPLVSNGNSPTGNPPTGNSPPAETLYVLAAAASSQQGSYTATPLANVSDYQVALASGAFQTGYPIPVPPAAAGSAPQMALHYDSGSVDGLTTTKNNQPGWVGLGWSLQSGAIVRQLKTCNLTQAPGDLCLTGNNYAIVLNGVSSRLVNQSGTLYSLQNDPRWKVEQFTNGVNGNPDTQKEYWLVTTPDGTKYRFGGEIDPESGADQNSVFYATVYNQATCSGVSTYWICDKAWQWNLDRVEDTNGNVSKYFYDLETNYYKARNDSTSPFRKRYVRAGLLNHIEYGHRSGVNSTTPPTRINFVTEERCTPGSACAWPADYPDTPGDLTCGTASTTGCLNTPTFWSRKRLQAIQTQTYKQSTSAYGNVARYALSYTFPAPPVGTLSEAKLWLTTITQKLGDGTGGLPAVQYGSTMLNNRKDYNLGAGVSPLSMPRLSQVTTPLGGVVTITYGQSHPCPANATGSFIRYPYDCFPAWFTNGSSSGWTLWNKWKVMQLTTADSFSGNATQTSTYSYSTPTWHYSDDPGLPDINSCTLCPTRHWNDWRGSDLVTVTDLSGAKTDYRFQRGMNGDRNTTAGGSLAATVALSDGSTRLDSNWLRGQAIETRRLTSANGAKQRTVNTFFTTLTAGSGDSGAYFVAVQQRDQTVTDATSKTSSVQYSYDPYGNVTREIRSGDTATTSDDRNTERSFVYNLTAYIVNQPAWEKLWTGAISGTAGQEKAFTEYAYDTLAYGAAPTKGNLTKTRSYAQTTPTTQAGETLVAYDSYGRPTSVTDARGKVTSTTYHPFYGYVSSVTNALNQVTSSVNDPGWGVATQTTDANNLVTNLQYDGYGRLSKVWLPTEPTSGVASYEFVYDAAARPATVKTRQLQVKASSTYLESWSYVDGFGRTLQSQTATSGGRVVTNQNYNKLGQLVYQSAPYALSGTPGSNYVPISNWNTATNYQQFYYDDLGRTTKAETRALASVLWSSQTTYNAWQTQQYDPNNHRRDATSNAFGQLVQVTEYNVGSVTYNTSYAYDYQGNLTQVTDNASNVTTMSYDLLGRKIAMTDPDMGSWQYQYDANGNLTGQKDGRNQWVYLAYDDLNRLSTKRQDNATTGALIADYTYDAVGQKGLLSNSRAYSAAGTTQITNVVYDARNRLTQQTWSVPGTGGGTFRLDYAYNEADQKTSLTYPGGNAGTQGETVTSSYNVLGQLTGVSGSGVAYVSAATYNAQGQLTQLVNENGNGANGLTRQWSYETNTLRLSTIQAGTNATFDNLQKLTYTYDNGGNVTNLVDTINSSQKQCYQYDWLDRLTGAFTGDAPCATFSATGTGYYNDSYTYNAIGNIISKNTVTYYYDANHKHGVTIAMGNTYGYDANGNQTTRTVAGVTYTLTYDYENHLTAVSGGSVSASFIYDADGNRVKGTVNGTTTVYIAGLYEYQGGATTLYYEGNALRRTGYATDNGVFYLLQDQLKSSSTLVNQNGTVNSRNYFYPFGGNRGGVAFSALTTKRFTGQYHEQGLPGGEGLSYYGARWYDAQLGRFASPDTIVPGAGNPQALNRYAYTLNNPLRYMDPTGHSVDRPGVGAGGTVVTQTHRLYPPISSNGGGSSQPLITAWYPSPAYSEWNNPSSFYTGCIKCHAASAWGKPALTNTELADAYERAQSNEAFMISTSVILALTGFDLLARAEPTLERSLGSDRAVRLVNVSKGVSNDTWFEDTTWVQMGTNDAGTVFYGTERDIKLFDVRQVVNRFGPKILVTGGHGGENGEFEKATELYIQDLEFSHSIQVVNFNLATPRQIMTLGGSGQSAFVAWCRSASCETLLELLH